MLTADKLLEMSKRCSEGTTVEKPGEIRFVEDQKYYLRQSTWRGVPMTEAQACRVHAVLGGQAGELSYYLSPRQLGFVQRLKDKPDSEDLYGKPFAASWWKLLTPPPEEDEATTATE